MRLDELREYLSANDITISVEGGELRYRGPGDALTPSVLNAMAEHKAALIESHESHPNGELVAALAAPDQSKPVRLSTDQESIWFLDQLHGGNPADHLSLAFRIEGVLDLDRLEEAVGKVLERHQILRSTYRQSADGPVQELQPLARPVIELSDLGDPGHDDGEAKARRLCAEEVQRVFDLEHDRALRVRVIRISHDRWVVLFVAHHIAFDGFSFSILFDELERFYGMDTPPQDLPLQYADYAQSQRAEQASGRIDAQIEYWKEHLGRGAVLELPTDRPRPAVQTPAGARHPVSIPADLKAGLQELGRGEGATLFMTLTAALQALLHRYTGQDRVAIGAPVSMRDRPELEQVIGLFLNMVVIQSEVDPQATFRDWLGSVRQTCRAAFANQRVPFERLVGIIQPERDLSHNPLFQVMLQLSPQQSLALPGLSVTPFDFERTTSQFDLSLHLYENDGGLVGHLEFDTDLFEPDRIERMAGHLLVLLNAAAADPDVALADLALLTPPESQQLLTDWNQTSTEFPSRSTVHELFADQAEVTPEATALIFNQQALTYHELNERANRLANHLREVGVERESLVGIFLERSVDMMVAVLATLKAGGAYVPMDPSFPADRLAFMLEDSGASVVISHDSMDRDFFDEQIATVLVDRDNDTISSRSTDEPSLSSGPDDLAYVIYTSGSTGKPKGVMVPHSAVVNFVTSMSRSPGMTAEDRIAAVTTLSFDIHVLELLAPLTVGAAIVLVPSDDAADGAALATLLADSRATMMQATPATWRLLVEADWTGPDGFRILCGGEALPPSLAAQLLDRAIEVWNMYGPTETTVWSTCALLSPNDPVTIGRPIANTSIYVLDGNLAPVPSGIPGELHIGGSGVTRGYLGRPELTADRFIADPFAESGNLYKTGDLVVYRPDGHLEYIRRLDDQVKVRGFRIELGEIEAVLSRHPTVQQSAVVVREDEPGDTRLVGYVAPLPGDTPTVGELRSFLLESLPGYMVPSALVVLDSLPLTPNGKVDKKALPEPDSSRPSLESSFVGPRTVSERAIAEIWQGLLRVDDIGVHDNFFDLGGHSLLLMQMRSRLQQLLGKEIPLTELFRNATVSELSNALGEIVAQPASAVTDDETPTGPVSVMPNAHRFLVERASPDVHHWNLSVLLTVPEGIELAMMADAAHKLTLHHDALRLRFENDSGTWRQWLAEPTGDFKIARHDLSELGEQEQLERLETVAKELNGGFDLATGPLLRMAYFDLGRRGRRLFIVLHHLVADGLSWNFLLEDLETAYDQLSRAEDVRLPAKSTSVQAWAEAMTESAQSPELRQDLGFWLSLPWSEIGTFPRDLDGDASDNTNGSTQELTVSLPAADTQILESNGLAVSTEEVLMASLARALARRNSEAVHFERLGHGRFVPAEHIELSRTVGFFLSYTPVVLRIPSSGEGRVVGLDDLGAQIRESTGRGSSFDLLRLVCRDRDVGQALRELPRAQISFNYRGRVEQFLNPGSMFEVAPEDDLTRHGHSPRALRYYPIAVVADLVDDYLTTQFVWSESLHRRETIQDLADTYLDEIRRFVSAIER